MNDPFDTMGEEPRFDLDLRMLEERHRELSRTLHPDRYARASSAERRMALGRAIEVNEAWRVLRDPIRRAEAVLRRRGVDVSETNQPKPPPSLLMEMMETREALSDAHRAKDLARVSELGAAMQTRQARVVDELTRGFTEADSDLDKLRSLLPIVGEMRYLRRFLDEVSAIEEDLAI